MVQEGTIQLEKCSLSRRESVGTKERGIYSASSWFAVWCSMPGVLSSRCGINSALRLIIIAFPTASSRLGRPPLRTLGVIAQKLLVGQTVHSLGRNRCNSTRPKITRKWALDSGDGQAQTANVNRDENQLTLNPAASKKQIPVSLEILSQTGEAGLSTGGGMASGRNCRNTKFSHRTAKLKKEKRMKRIIQLADYFPSFA